MWRHCGSRWEWTETVIGKRRQVEANFQGGAITSDAGQLNAYIQPHLEAAAASFAESGSKVRWFTDLHYVAKSWEKRNNGLNI